MNLHDISPNKNIVDFMQILFPDHDWEEKNNDLYYKGHYQLAEWTKMHYRDDYDTAFQTWKREGCPTMLKQEINERYGL